LCAQNCHNFNVTSLDLAKSDVCVTVNVCTQYDKNQIEQNLAVSIQSLLYYTRVGTLIVATIYLQLIQNRYMFRSFTVLQC